jgi:hypothetical protein
MAKKTYVNEVDGFFIMAHRDMPLGDLSKKLKLETTIIREYIDSKIDTKTTVSVKVTNDDAFKAVGRNREATVMTKAASEIGDSVKAKKNWLNPSHICKIREN